MSEIHRRVPDGTNLSSHLLEMIADHHRNLGRARKVETLPNSPDLSLTVLDDWRYLRF